MTDRLQARMGSHSPIAYLTKSTLTGAGAMTRDRIQSLVKLRNGLTGISNDIKTIIELPLGASHAVRLLPAACNALQKSL